MIQFNLLPDIKLEYMRARRTKRLVVAISAVSTAVSLFIMISLLLVVFAYQRTYIGNLSEDIAAHSADLTSTPDLNKILTIQNQLDSVNALHQAKPDTTRVLPYLKQLTPVDVRISSLTISYVENTVMISGSADSLKAINQYVDTLKFTKYSVPPVDGIESEPAPAFTSTVLTNFGRDQSVATYTINASFAPEIFDNTKKVTLVVPSIVTTRSVTEKPTDLFEMREDN